MVKNYAKQSRDNIKMNPSSLTVKLLLDFSKSLKTVKSKKREFFELNLN